MEKFKKLLSVILALAMICAMAGCTGGETTEPTEDTQVQTGETTAYTVKLHSAGGMALSEIDVYVYADNTLADMKEFGQTNAEGEVSFQLAEGGEYAIALSGVPKGYEVAESYSFSGTEADITLTSSLISGESLSGSTLGLGDVMYDFSVVLPSGESVTLSEMLAEKEMVLLNFWYTTCTWCLTEFPFMQEAYEQYSDSVGIIALDPFDQNPAVEAFQAQYGYTFPMANCPAAWSSTFNVSGYPTSIVVDRYGVICLVEAGGITSLRPFISMFDHFTGNDYEQQLFGQLGELVTDVKPTYTMDSSENIAALLNSGDIQVTYRPEEGDSAEFCWPFIAAEKNGENCLKASNQGIESSFAILYADVELKAGQAVGFDYLASSERSCDIMYVIVDGEDVYAISGVSEPEEWVSCYPWVAEADGTYEVALCYLKDEADNVGDDTVYIKNMRVVDASEINVATYIPRYAATAVDDGFEYNYVDVVLGADGYYHVGDANGPLLLADLMNYTQFNEEKTIWELVYDGTVTVDGHDYYEEIVEYCNYASNSSLNGVCTVNEELAELLKIVADVAGFEGGENEWLKICKYFQVYGADNAQLQYPIKGLTTFSAYEAKLGVDVPTNYFYYDRAILPRGLLAKFVPTQSGVYRITTETEYEGGLDAWIFNENREEIYTHEPDERAYNDDKNISMVYYMEAGKPYFIDIAFWDVYNVGYIYYDIEYIGSSYDLFRLAAPGYFTYDTNATGEAMYHLISGGIDVVLGDDGLYYEDLGLDANGNQRYGSKLYCDFSGLTSLFSTPIATVPMYNEDGTPAYNEDGTPKMLTGMIEKGGFDFSKTEEDLYVLAMLKQNGNDVEATDAYLRELWGDTYDEYAAIYQVEDVYEGKYHGTGEDLTAEMQTYVDQMITSGEAKGCVVVNERLAELLQLLMGKYTFAGVDDAWTKLCYYYDHLGPNG